MNRHQREGLEKITGKPVEGWHPEAIKAYFAWTDRGIQVDVSDEARADLNELLLAHRFHPITVEMWKQDFRKGLLFLDDFLEESSPQAYIDHVLHIYESCMGGYIPYLYRLFMRARHRYPQVTIALTKQHLVQKL